MTKIYYYLSRTGKNPVREFIESLEKLQKGRVLKVFAYIETYGPRISISQIKKLFNTPFWEIRILGNSNIRIIYFIKQGDNVLVLHGFVKKKQKTPKRELETTFERYKDWLKRTS